MSFNTRHAAWHNAKEAILILCILYFFALALAIQTGRPTYHTESPVVFLSVFALFMAAIFIEAVLEWGKRRYAIFWGALFILSYIVIGIYVVPNLFGSSYLVYSLLEPVIICFFGGFAYAYAKIFTDIIFFSPQLSSGEIREAIKALPGWEQKQFFEKTFQFEDFVSGLNFINRCAEFFSNEEQSPVFVLQSNHVTFRFRPHPLRGISRTQIEIAKKIEQRA